MGGIIALVMGSKAGKYLAVCGAALLGMFVIFVKIFHSGAQAARAKAVQQNLTEVSDAQTVDESVAARGDAANRGELQHWARD